MTSQGFIDSIYMFVHIEPICQEPGYEPVDTCRNSYIAPHCSESRSGDSYSFVVRMAMHMTAKNGGAKLSLASAKEAENLSIGESMMLDYIVPMAMKAILQLGVPDILIQASGPMTVEEIVEQLSCESPTDTAVNLQRILSFLVRKGVFSESSDGEYALTDLGEMFTINHKFSLVPYANLLVHNAMLDPFNYLPAGILTNSIPWNAAHGLPIYAEHPKYPDWAATFNTGLVGSTHIIAGRIAAEYPGFKTVKSVVDVGGGLGTAIAIFVAAHPHIRGINYDLPHVVASAPAIPGVEHVGGDFSVSIPSADLIFMKGILHNYDDERCAKILKNCYEALPKNGKVLVSETYITDEQTSKVDFALKSNLLMMSCFLGGCERTLEQYTTLLMNAGFSFPTFTKRIESSDILEATKL